MRHCVPGQYVLFPLGPKCTIPFCRGELAPLRQSVHVGTPWSLARHTIYRTNMYRHISIVVRFQKHWIQGVHCTLIWNIERHKTPFASKAGLYGTKDPSSADFSNNFKWYMSLVRIYTVWNTIPPIDGIMTLQCHGVIVLWCHCIVSWCHGGCGRKYRWCNTVWNAAPPIDGIRPNGQNLARNILTSLISSSSSSSSSLWYHYLGIIIVVSSLNNGIRPNC